MHWCRRAPVFVARRIVLSSVSGVFCIDFKNRPIRNATEKFRLFEKKKNLDILHACVRYYRLFTVHTMAIDRK